MDRWTIKPGIQTAGRNKIFPKFALRAHTTALWPVEQSSILSAKFDCPMARQNLSLLATAHDCGSGEFLHKTIAVLFEHTYGQ